MRSSVPSLQSGAREDTGSVEPVTGSDEGREQLERDHLRRQVLELQRISSLGMIAGGICHELNNLLTPILNYAKLGLRSDDPAYRTRAFEKILEAAQQAAQITGGVLGLARPSGETRVPTDLAALVEQVLRLTRKDLMEHRVTLEYHARERPRARVNPAQIQQVLFNLVINARQAMPQGGRMLVQVGLDATGRMAELVVADSGVGIDPAGLRRIFDPFFTTKTGPDESGLGGTGLGLSVCREIIEAHKGRIRATSKVGVGTTFCLKLPLDRESESSGETQHAAASPSSSRSNRNDAERAATSPPATVQGRGRETFNSPAASASVAGEAFCDASPSPSPSKRAATTGRGRSKAMLAARSVVDDSSEER